MIPYCYWTCIVLAHFSTAFWVATALFNVACIVYTYYNTKDITRPHLMQEDLLDVRRKVARAKKVDSQWLLVGILGFRIHFKTQRQYQDVIDQIEDLTAEG